MINSLNPSAPFKEQEDQVALKKKKANAGEEEDDPLLASSAVSPTRTWSFS